MHDHTIEPRRSTSADSWQFPINPSSESSIARMYHVIVGTPTNLCYRRQVRRSVRFLLALIGGLLATTVMTQMTPRAYVMATENAITAADFLAGLVKTPFLALAVGLIACGQGLATQGGAAAVGARTTTAVVLGIFSVIVISALFTFLYALLGV